MHGGASPPDPHHPDPIPPDLLLRAYRSGIFPMSDHREDDEVFWVEPRKRAIFPLEDFRVSKSLRKTIRQDRFRVTCDTAFAQVIEACAQPREDFAESWISHRIEASYLALFEAGHAHSFECWLPGPEGRDFLVGGLYGVAFDRVFCGESMFSRADDASKVALGWLVACMRRAGYRVLDCQFMTEHLASMGAVAVPQTHYLEMVARATSAPEASLAQVWSDYASSADDSDSGSDSASSSAAPSSPGKLIAQSFTKTS